MKATALQLNTIYIQDCFSFLQSLENESIDLAIIDPPYNLKVADWDSFKSEQEFLDFSFAWIDLMLQKMKKSGSFYIFNTPYHCALFLHYLQGKAVFQNFITWYKKDGLSYTKKKFVNNQESILFYTMDSKDYYFDYDSVRIPYESTQRIAHAREKGILKNGKRWYPNKKGKLCPDVWEIVSQRHKQKLNGKTQKLNHPTPKPKEMIERMIKASSKEGDLVLDLFAGSGTTSKVAKEFGRNYIGCELNSGYLDSSLEIRESK
ncbi:DNA-methyltransferase [Helicobacter himalayensis]|uniref:DNA-methyltransferase n=1 Tax=Helicobacter himalayensis TaxID=1591088 RepID=UPI003D6EC0EC